MRIVIGLTGVKTSGKSTVANLLKDLILEDVQESALADKLKNVCSKVFDVPREHFDKQDLKEVPFKSNKILTENDINLILSEFEVNPTKELIYFYNKNNIINKPLKSPRQIAQIVGTEILRAAGDEDIHCKNLKLGNNVTIISDIRFPNEFNYFENLPNTYFLPFYIQRDEAEKYINSNSHSSETSVFTFCQKCININNNKDLEFLKKQIMLHLYRIGLKIKGHNL